MILIKVLDTRSTPQTKEILIKLMTLILAESKIRMRKVRKHHSISTLVEQMLIAVRIQKWNQIRSRLVIWSICMPIMVWIWMLIQVASKFNKTTNNNISTMVCKIRECSNKISLLNSLILDFNNQLNNNKLKAAAPIHSRQRMLLLCKNRQPNN